MVKIFILAFFLIKSLNANFVDEASIDYKSNPPTQNDLRFEITVENFDQLKFPSSFSAVFNNQIYDFAKKSPLGNNANGVFHLNQDKTVTKIQNSESKLVNDYKQLNGDGFLTLIRGDLANNGNFFRITGKIFQDQKEISIDIIPSFKRADARKKRFVSETFNYTQNKIKDTDRNHKPNLIIHKGKRILAPNLIQTANRSSQQMIPGVTNFGKTCVFGKSYSFCDVCGVQPVQPNVKIVGGTNAVKNSWPSLAFLALDYTFNFKLYGITYRLRYKGYCGATLIDRKTVITAAHCIKDSYSKYGVTVNFKNDPLFPSNAYKVYLGLQSSKGIFSGGADLSGVSVMTISSIKSHENFDNITYGNDISIIKLKNEARYGAAVQPACLPPSRTYKAISNVPVWIAGWGVLTYGGVAKDILQNAKITYYYSGAECRAYVPYVNWDKQICAGEIYGGKDTCQGDSGGPLYVKVGKTFIFVGTTSYGLGCGDPGYPGIYTRVAFYLDWILRNM